MPGIIVTNSSEKAGRRFFLEGIAQLESQGFELIRSQDGGEWQDIFALIQTRGLFSGQGYVRVESAENLGRFPEELEDYVEATDVASTFLVLSYSVDYKKFFPGGLRSLVRVIIPPQVPRWRNKRYEWFSSYVAEKRITIDDNALMLLVDTVEEPEEIISEIDKLALASGETPVSIDMVKSLTLDEGKNALLELMDGICLARHGQVIRSFVPLKRRSELIPVLSALYNRIRIAVLVQILRKHGVARIRRELNFRDYQFKRASELLERYEHEDIFGFASEIIMLNYREKTSAAQGWPAFESIVLKFLAKTKKDR